MAIFEPRTFPQILGEMISRLVATTPLTDVNFGSVFTTMLEAAAQEDDEQYFQMLEIIRGFSLDTTTGEDLDDRAFEYGLERKDPVFASTIVTLGDSSFTKIFTGIYSGLPGPAAGTFSVNGDSATGFPTSGTIIVGRGTPNAETVNYTSITQFTNYAKFNLSTGLSFDHGTDETIVFSQGGSRLFPAGTTVVVPASDINPRVEFTLDNAATLLDGEDTLENVAVTAAQAGSDANVPIGSITEFDSPPFANATVTNPNRVTNGGDEESDQELRDRIKEHIQSLSRGTVTSVISGVTDVISEEENKRVVSAALVEPTIPAGVSKLYIDDGTGFIPVFTNVGFEEVVASATGGEKFLDIANIPVMKAFVESENAEPYNLSGGETLFVRVGSLVETITFDSLDFSNPGVALAQEVLTKINSAASLFEARASSGGTKVRIFARANFDEQIQVTGGTANSILSFPTDLKFTTKLYKEVNNEVFLLTKDGITASVEAGNPEFYDMTGAFPKNFVAIVDGKTESPINIWIPSSDFLVPLLGTAEEARLAVETRVPGITAELSSNDTKFTLLSNIERSSESKIQVIENFSLAWVEESSVFIDRTTAFRTAGTDVTIFPSNLDYMYLGHSTVPFETVYVNLATPSSADVSLTFEFWNGSSWVTLPVIDRTFGMTQSGHIVFGRPFDWAKTTVNGSAAMYWIRLRRNNAAAIGVLPVESRIRIQNANEQFGFLETEIVGVDKDYTLNRFMGQIELETTLQSGDRVTLGSYNTRAFAVTQVTGNYNLSGGELFTVNVDGVAQNYTFLAGDFTVPGSATPAEVQTALQNNLVGVTVSLVQSGLKVRLESNTYNGGTLEVTTSVANNILQFPEDVKTSFIPHIPALESGNAEPYSFAVGDEVVFIIDENLANNYTVPCTYAGTLTGVTNPSTVADTGLNPVFPLDSDLPGYEIELTSGAFSGERRIISTYTAATGTIVTTAPFSGAPAVTDTYEILPTDADQVVRLWNNSQVTLLSVSANILQSSGGVKVQVNSKAIGEDASVQVFGGTGNVVLGFPLTISRGVDGYRYFTGLAQEAQKTVDGVFPYDTYPGIRAAGVQIEVIEPVIKFVIVDLTVIPLEGITLSSIVNDVKSAVSAYINTLEVGGDVIKAEITATVKRDVEGVFDVTVNVPTDNIPIADNELARIREDDLTVG